MFLNMFYLKYVSAAMTTITIIIDTRNINDTFMAYYEK